MVDVAKLVLVFTLLTGLVTCLHIQLFSHYIDEQRCPDWIV